MNHSHDDHDHDHDHNHHHYDPVRAQSEATVIGWIDGVPVGREILDERLSQLRGQALAGCLPAQGSQEDRQFVRWTAQVLLTEQLCQAEAQRRGLTAAVSTAVSTASGAGRPLDRVEALHLGSINAAAWAGGQQMAALFEAVVPALLPAVVPAGLLAGLLEMAGPPGESVPLTQTRTWWRVRHALGADQRTVLEQELLAAGWTTLEDLPESLAGALRASPLGTRVGPVRSELGWHVAMATETALRPAGFPCRAGASGGATGGVADGATGGATDGVVDGERLREFARWLDQLRSQRLRLAEGFEHPGDPTQPDNTHRH